MRIGDFHCRGKLLAERVTLMSQQAPGGLEVVENENLWQPDL